MASSGQGPGGQAEAVSTDAAGVCRAVRYNWQCHDHCCRCTASCCWLAMYNSWQGGVLTGVLSCDRAALCFHRYVLPAPLPAAPSRLCAQPHLFRQAFHGPPLPPLPLLLLPPCAAARRPATPEAPPLSDDSGRCAALVLLQRLLRGRAVQNEMYAGMMARLALVRELRLELEGTAGDQQQSLCPCP